MPEPAPVTTATLFWKELTPKPYPFGTGPCQGSRPGSPSMLVALRLTAYSR